MKKKYRLTERFYNLFTIAMLAIMILVLVIAYNDKQKAEAAAKPAYDIEHIADILLPKVNMKTFVITHYCSCAICCGHNAKGITASGKHVATGMIAADTSQLPFGTEVTIDGKFYTVEDTGSAIGQNRIDIYVSQAEGGHQEAIRRGIIKRIVIIKEEPNDK